MPTPTPTVVIEPPRGFFDVNLRELWDYRELIYFMVWRDVKTRYKQTILGFSWAIFQPLLTILIFWAIFSVLARFPSDGIPYPLFACCGILPWNYFSQAVARSSGGLVGNANLVSKIYFPRLILPLSAAIVPAVDFLVSLVVLAALMAFYGRAPASTVVLIPLLGLVAFATALGMGLWMSALHVRYRDVAMLVPFVVQVWMYASPVFYPLSMVPERWQAFYGLNPMVGVITGFRWVLLGGQAPDPRVGAVSLLAVAGLVLSGLWYFKRAEREFADVI